MRLRRLCSARTTIIPAARRAALGANPTSVFDASPDGECSPLGKADYWPGAAAVPSGANKNGILVCDNIDLFATEEHCCFFRERG